MQQKFKYLVVVLLINLISHLGLAVDKKLIDGSDAVEPSIEVSRFLTSYTHVINNKDDKTFVDMFEPASLECYQNSKHPEHYKTEIEKILNRKIGSLKELRKYKAGFESNKLAKYPKAPTHLAIFNVDEKGTDTQSVELVEKDGRFFLAFRCL